MESNNKTIVIKGFGGFVLMVCLIALWFAGIVVALGLLTAFAVCYAVVAIVDATSSYLRDKFRPRPRIPTYVCRYSQGRRY